jgi:hypothetical protein
MDPILADETLTVRIFSPNDAGLDPEEPSDVDLQ